MNYKNQIKKIYIFGHLFIFKIIYKIETKKEEVKLNNDI